MEPLLEVEVVPPTTPILETPFPTSNLSDIPGFFPTNNNNNNDIVEPKEDSSTTTSSSISLPSASMLLGGAAAIVLAPALGLAALSLGLLRSVENDGLTSRYNSLEELAPTTTTTATTTATTPEIKLLDTPPATISEAPVDLSQSPVMKELGNSHGLESLVLGATGASIVDHEVPTPIVATTEEVSPVSPPPPPPTTEESRLEDTAPPVSDKGEHHSFLKGAGAGLVAGVGGVAIADHLSTNSSGPTLRSTGSATPTLTPSSHIERSVSYSTQVENTSPPTLHSMDSNTSGATITQDSYPFDPLPLSSSSTEFPPSNEASHRPELQSRFSDSTFSPSLLASDDGEDFDTYESQRAYQALGGISSLGDEPRMSTKPLDPAVDLKSNELSASETGFPLTSSGHEAQQDFAHLSTPFISEEQQHQQPSFLAPSVSTTTSNSQEEDGTSFDERTKWGKEAYLALGVGGAGAVAGAGLMAHKLSGHESADDARTSTASSPSPFQYNRTASPQYQGQQNQQEDYSVHHNAADYAQAHRPITPPPQQQQSQEYNHVSRSPTQHDLTTAARERSNSNQAPSPTPSQLLHQQLNQSSNNPNPVEHSPHLGIATRVDSISGRKKLHKDSLTRDSSLNTGGRVRSQSTSEGNRRFASEGGMVGNGNGYGGNGNGNQGSNDLWRTSVAKVVNDETGNRGGQRPAFVSIDTEDRRDYQSSQQPGNRQLQYQSSLNRHDNRDLSSTPSTPPQDHRKLTKNRRASVSNVEHRDRYYSSPENTNNGSPSSQKKEGFLHKVFGRHHHSPSKSSSS